MPAFALQNVVARLWGRLFALLPGGAERAKISRFFSINKPETKKAALHSKAASGKLLERLTSGPPHVFGPRFVNT